MTLLKPLRYYISKYRSIERQAIDGASSLYVAKDRLDALDREYAEDNRQSPDRLLADLTEPNQVKLWTTGDGSRVQVGAMSDQHLHYALAKAQRGEYPDSYSRQTGVRALKIEAFRRLRNELTAPTVDASMPRWNRNYMKGNP